VDFQVASHNTSTGSIFSDWTKLGLSKCSGKYNAEKCHGNYDARLPMDPTSCRIRTIFTAVIGSHTNLDGGLLLIQPGFSST